MSGTATPSMMAARFVAAIGIGAALSIAACGRNEAPADTATATAAFMHPVGNLGEADVKLFEAAGKGDVDGVNEALEAGANPNVADKLMRTPLFGAAFYNRAATADVLLTRGADANAKDGSGLSPLHAGVAAGGKDVVAALLAKGAAVNARSIGGKTPLHFAAATNQEALVDLLLENGANPHAKDNDGLTPGALAARNGHPAIRDRIKRWGEAHNGK